ncbi:MAG: universal stress protein [Verrucomicrobiota bacterium]
MDSLFGSTTERVLSQEPVPVLIVPNSPKDGPPTEGSFHQDRGAVVQILARRP